MKFSLSLHAYTPIQNEVVSHCCQSFVLLSMHFNELHDKLGLPKWISNLDIPPHISSLSSFPHLKLQVCM